MGLAHFVCRLQLVDARKPAREPKISTSHVGTDASSARRLGLFGPLRFFASATKASVGTSRPHSLCGRNHAVMGSDSLRKANSSKKIAKAKAVHACTDRD